ncbi:MAG: transcriptional regulator [Magnetospirillum sp.]|nr:transcriptional regulator [Magnetospirillum sp.]
MNKPITGTATAKARAAWGDDLPDWIAKLAQAIDLSSQNKVAERLDYSPAALSQVINNRYKAPLTGIEQAVRGALMAATVACPIVGELAADTCLANQRAPYSPHNPSRIAFFTACRKCENRRDKNAQ